MRVYDGKTCDPVKLPPEMNKEQMREDFEAECRSSDYLIPLNRMEGGEYCYISAEWKWEGWQAACKSKQKEINSLQAQLRDRMEEAHAKLEPRCTWLDDYSDIQPFPVVKLT